MIKRIARMSHSNYLLAVLLLHHTTSVVYARGQTHSLANMSTAAFTIAETDEQSVYTERRQIKVLLNDLTDYPLDPTVRPPVPVTISSNYRNNVQRVRDFQVFEDDVWIVTFPKSGTTWAEEMTWLINHDLDYDTARSIKLNSRSTFLEIGAISDLFPIDTIAVAEKSPRPRQIKSHLPLSLLPRQLWTVKPKIVYVARNPKDVAISFFHHYRVFVGYNGTKETFLTELLADKVTYCPMVPHVLDFWALKQEPNVLFLTYESMKRNLRALLPQVCRHFNKTYSEAQLDELAVHLSFNEMKKNPATNKDDVVRNALAKDKRENEQFKFLRKGIVGDYRNELPEEFNIRFDRFIAEQLSGSDFRYDYD